MIFVIIEIIISENDYKCEPSLTYQAFAACIITNMTRINRKLQQILTFWKTFIFLRCLFNPEIQIEKVWLVTWNPKLSFKVSQEHILFLYRDEKVICGWLGILKSSLRNGMR